MVPWPRRPLLQSVALLLLGAAAQEEHFVPEPPAPAPPRPQPHPTVQLDAVDLEDVHELAEMLAAGQGLVCCGHWRREAARQFQERVAAQLGSPHRQLGDVHLANASAHIRSGGHGGWGASAVLYLDEPAQPQGERVTLAMLSEGSSGGELEAHEIGEPMVAPAGALVIVPDGGQLLHASPRRVAFLRIRRESSAGGASAGRSVFEYYVASWVRKNFVAPYDTGAQRQFFRNHTKYPRYWHGFFWSFLGMFCTVFACFPLAWWGMQLAEKLMQPEPEKPCEAAAEKVMNVPGTPTKPPTLLPRLGADARLFHHPHKSGGNRLLPPHAEKGINNIDAGLLYRSC